MNTKLMATTLLSFPLYSSFIFAGHNESELKNITISEYSRLEPLNTIDDKFPKKIKLELQKLLKKYELCLPQQKNFSNVDAQIDSMLVERNIKTAANIIQNKLLAFLGLKFSSSKITVSIKHVCEALIEAIAIRPFIPNKQKWIVQHIYEKVTNLFNQIEEEQLNEKVKAHLVCKFIINSMIKMLPLASKQPILRNKKVSCSEVISAMKKELEILL